MSKKRKAKQVNLALIVDILHIFVKFQLIYCMLLVFYYWDYADGKGSFQPILYITPLGIMIIVKIFSNYIKNPIFALLSGIVLGGMLILQLPLDGNKLWISLAIVFALLTEFLQINTGMSGEKASYGARFRKVGRSTTWGAGIVVASIYFSFTIGNEIEDLAIQPYQCRQYMLVTFGIYLVFNILMQYAFQYLNYYRRAGSVGEKSIHQTKRSGYFAAVLIMLLFAFVVFLGFRPVEQFLRFVIPKLLYIVCFVFLALAGKLGELKLMNFQSVVEKASSQKISMEKVKNVSDGGFSSRGYLLAPLLVCGLVYVIWKLYKGMLTNYKMGDDRAEYIPIFEDRNLILSDERRIIRRAAYGNTNNERVRKHYYKSLRRRIQAYKGAHVDSRTPEELVVPLGRSKEERQQLWALTRHYEKARYSNEECTDAEVEESKAAQDYMQRGQIPNSPLTSEKSISIIEDK